MGLSMALASNISSPIGAHPHTCASKSRVWPQRFVPSYAVPAGCRTQTSRTLNPKPQTLFITGWHMLEVHVLWPGIAV